MKKQQKTYRIAHLSFFTDSAGDGSYTFQARGQRFEVQRFCTGGSVPYFKALSQSLRTQVDGFAFSGLPPVGKIRGKSYFHADYLDLMSLPSSVPVCDGYRIRELFALNGLVEEIEAGTIQPREGVFFPMGLSHPDVIRLLKKYYSNKLYFADAASLLGLPLVIESGSRVMEVGAPLGALVFAFRDARKMVPSSERARDRKIQERVLGHLKQARYVFADAHLLALFGDQLSWVRGKELVVPVVDPRTRQLLETYEPARIIDLFPKAFRYAPEVNPAVVDCTHRLLESSFRPLSLEYWESQLSASTPVHRKVHRQLFSSPVSSRASVQRDLVKKVNSLRNRVQKSRRPPAPDFAFIVHPLSVGDLFRVPGVHWLSGMSEKFSPQFEKLASRAPGFEFGRIEHIMSQKNGREVRGLIYALPATPKMLMNEDPRVTYQRIEAICRDAEKKGAKILGLGAYTKIVGDAGLTIHKNSPIPVTTGNSLSASATLWGVYEVSMRLGLLRVMPDGKRLDGTAVVIGATGSIGRVSSKLLSLAFPRLRLVAPRLERLEELAQEIRELSRSQGQECEVQVSTQGNDFAREADVLITATSAFDQKVVEVDLLKPGCVVCDCSRPLDFTLDDAIKRPDVLIIESGEVELPGPVSLTCDIGLPGTTVYACLAETAVLAMERLHEPFSMGRELDWQKVKQIYKLAREHGVTLSAIRGHAGVVSDLELRLMKDLAIRRRKELGIPVP